MTDIILTSLALGFVLGVFVACSCYEIAADLIGTGRVSRAASTLSESGREKIRAKVEDTTRKLRRELGR